MTFCRLNLSARRPADASSRLVGSWRGLWSLRLSLNANLRIGRRKKHEQTNKLSFHHSRNERLQQHVEIHCGIPSKMENPGGSDSICPFQIRQTQKPNITHASAARRHAPSRFHLSLELSLNGAQTNAVVTPTKGSCWVCRAELDMK